VLLYLLNNNILKAGPTGPRGTWENYNWPRTWQHGWPLNVHEELTYNMYVNFSWLKVEERLTSSLLAFVRSIDLLNAQRCLSKLLAHSSDTHAYPQDMPPEVSSQFSSPERTMTGAQYYIQPCSHGSLYSTSSNTQAVKSDFFKIQIKIHLVEQRGL
jgi:hypothetical protein